MFTMNAQTTDIILQNMDFVKQHCDDKPIQNQQHMLLTSSDIYNIKRHIVHNRWSISIQKDVKNNLENLFGKKANDIALTMVTC